MTTNPEMSTNGEPVALVDRDKECQFLEIYLSKGMNVQIVGPAGVGKTALLTNVGRIAARLPGKFVVAYADLADPRCQTVRGLVERVSAGWRLSPPSTALVQLGEQVRELRQRGVRPVLCLDNFEILLQRGDEFNTDFLVDVRGVSQAGMMIITAARKSLSELLPWYGRTSPFYASFEVSYLGPLRREQADEFIASACAGKVTLTPQQKEKLFEMTRGYPLFLQQACELAVRAKQKGETFEAALGRAEQELRSLLPAWTPAKR
jgi:hypothetical protein